MVEIAFQRKYQVNRNSFSQEIRRKFSFANEYFEVLLKSTNGISIFLDKFILKLVKKQNFKKEYDKLTLIEKEFARDLIYSVIQLKPELVDKRIVLNALSNEKAKGKKAILSSLELLEKFIIEKKKNKNKEKIPFFDSQNKYFGRIAAVGKGIYTLDDKYLQKNNFIKDL